MIRLSQLSNQSDAEHNCFSALSRAISESRGPRPWHLRAFRSPSGCGMDLLAKTPLSPLDLSGFSFSRGAF